MNINIGHSPNILSLLFLFLYANICMLNDELLTVVINVVVFIVIWLSVPHIVFLDPYRQLLIRTIASHCRNYYLFPAHQTYWCIIQNEHVYFVHTLWFIRVALIIEKRIIVITTSWMYLFTYVIIRSRVNVLDGRHLTDEAMSAHSLTQTSWGPLNVLDAAVWQLFNFINRILHTLLSKHGPKSSRNAYIYFLFL